ncbi:MAG: DNA alkylation repair protein [Acidobacteria bacterium]|nr:DNA alkylation repair protein [Acidobacteriota bacterium]
MTTEALLAQARLRLEAMASPDHAASMQRFFKGPVELRGARADDLRQLGADLYRTVKAWPAAERNAFATALWESPFGEDGIVASYLLGRFGKRCGIAEFATCEGWITRYVQNWAQTDAVCTLPLAAAIAAAPELSARLTAWTASGNRWQRRSSAVALVKEVRAGRQAAQAIEIARRLLGDRDEMVQKGCGWLLKEACAKHRDLVVPFLETEGRLAPRLLLRYAAEKMTPADRKRVLG